MFMGVCLWTCVPSNDRNDVITCICLREMIVLDLRAANAESKVDTIHLQRRIAA